jgi:hypothetical protein
MLLFDVHKARRRAVDRGRLPDLQAAQIKTPSPDTLPA